MKDPWRHLYLQQNLQELVSKLNDNPDFKVSVGLAYTCGYGYVMCSE